jgi:hypothetical protein
MKGNYIYILRNDFPVSPFYALLICGCTHPDETSMDSWKQGLVMPQVAGTELLVARTVQWLHFNPHGEIDFSVQVESYASHVKIE